MNAIRAYQAAKGLTVNGLVTDELVSSLGIVEAIQEAVALEQRKASYSGTFAYADLQADPKKYEGQLLTIAGTVRQSEAGIALVRVEPNALYYVTCPADLTLAENDAISVYGAAKGNKTYTSLSGEELEIPWLEADILERS